MIVIEITNIREVVRQERGYWVAKIGPYLTDMDAAVEETIIAEIQEVFARRGIEANIVRLGRASLHAKENNGR